MKKDKFINSLFFDVHLFIDARVESVILVNVRNIQGFPGFCYITSDSFSNWKPVNRKQNAYADNFFFQRLFTTKID